LEKELFKICRTAGSINQSNAERDHHRFAVNFENSPDRTGCLCDEWSMDPFRQVSCDNKWISLSKALKLSPKSTVKVQLLVLKLGCTRRHDQPATSVRGKQTAHHGCYRKQSYFNPSTVILRLHESPLTSSRNREAAAKFIETRLLIGWLPCAPRFRTGGAWSRSPRGTPCSSPGTAPGTGTWRR
jgi:hypothetical protein